MNFSSPVQKIMVASINKFDIGYLQDQTLYSRSGFSLWGLNWYGDRMRRMMSASRYKGEWSSPKLWVPFNHGI